MLKDKLEAQHAALPKVRWDDKEVDNAWQCEYLGSTFQSDGQHLPDVRRRIAMAMQRSGTLRHIWSATTLKLTLKLRLYVSACCSMMCYGSEAWVLDNDTIRALNGANATMLSHITGKSHKQEAGPDCTFNLLSWIRARRLKWVGHILRMNDNRLIKQTLHHIYENRQKGDILMDTPDESWQELTKRAQDRTTWRAMVHKVKAMSKMRQHKDARSMPVPKCTSTLRSCSTKYVEPTKPQSKQRKITEFFTRHEVSNAIAHSIPMAVQAKLEATNPFVTKSAQDNGYKNTELVWYTANDERITPTTPTHIPSDNNPTTNTTNMHRTEDDTKAETDYAYMASTYIPSDIDMDTPPPMDHTFMVGAPATFTHNDGRNIMGHRQRTNNNNPTTPTILPKLLLSPIRTTHTV